MKKNISLTYLLMLVLCIAIIPRMANASGEKQIPPHSNELPWIQEFGIGARAMGMGGTAISIVEDGTALYWNPAGLARIRATELMGTLSHKKMTTKTEFFGNSDDAEVSETSFNSFSLSYPFPTYRGSWVVAFGINRVMSFDDDYIYEGFNNLPADTLYLGGRREKESFWEDGGLTDWSFGTAIDISENTSIGGAFHYYNGSLASEWVYRAENTDNNPAYNWDYAEQTVKRDADIHGYSFNFGSIVTLNQYLSGGITIVSPMKLTIEGDKTTSYAGIGLDGNKVYFEDDITLPYRFGFGISGYPPNMVIGLDVWYTDWTQMEYGSDKRTINDFDEERYGYRPYRSTTDITLGVEYLFSFYPARLRAGFAKKPLAYALDEITTDRYSYSLGAGILVDKVTAIDIAYTYSIYEKQETSIPPNTQTYLTEETTNNKFLVSLGYRF